MSVNKSNARSTGLQWPPTLAVRGSSRRGTIRTPTAANQTCASGTARSKRVDQYLYTQKFDRCSRRVSLNFDNADSASNLNPLGRTEHLSRNAAEIPQVFAGVNYEPPYRPALRKVKGQAPLQGLPVPPSEDRLGILRYKNIQSDDDTVPRKGSFQLNFRERAKLLDDRHSGIYLPEHLDIKLQSIHCEERVTPDCSRNNTGRTSNDKLSTPLKQATLRSALSQVSRISDHPCGDLITFEMLDQILHCHPARELFRATLMSIGNQGWVDSWLHLRAQDAAQAYSSTSLTELRSASQLSFDSACLNRSDTLEIFFLERLLKEGLPYLMTSIVNTLLQTTSLREALEFQAQNIGSIAHSDSLFTDGRNISKTVPNLLRSFCITDTKLDKIPINVSSRDVIQWNSLEQGESLYLNLPGGMVVPACDEYGAIYSLAFSASLLDRAGKADFTLVSTVNISHFIKKYVKNVLIGHIDHVNEKTAVESPILGVDWIEIAYEESLKSRADPAEVNRSFDKLEDCTDISELIKQMKILYKDCFIMSSSQSGSDSFEITHCSQSLLHTGLDPFKYISPDHRRWIMAELGKEQSFAVRIIWGEMGANKWMYSTPMFGPDLECWVCVLIDGDIPNIWED